MSGNEDAPSLAHALHKAFILFGPKPFLGYPNGQVLTSNYSDINFTWLTYDEVFRKSLQLAANLKLTSLPERSVIGICADNSIEWLVTDYSCSFNDYVTVGLHSSWNEESLIHVLTSSEVRCIVCMACHLSKFLKLSLSCLSIQSIIVIEIENIEICCETIKQFREYNLTSLIRVYSFNELLTGNFSMTTRDLDVGWKGEILSSSANSYESTTFSGAGADVPSWFGLHNRISPEESDEIYSLMYTSGTTGSPKGVAVTKSRWLVDARSNSFSGQSDPTVVSYMSLAHGGDRGICWQACFAGARIGLVSPSTHDALVLLRNIKAVKPTFLLCMSYLWCEYFALFKRDLEQRVVEYIMTSRLAKAEIVRHFCLGSHQIVNSEDYGAMTVERNICLSTDVLTDEEKSDRLHICLVAMRQQEDWGSFVNAAGSLLGIKDLLLLEWYDLFGGRVFVPVTGGGHTSEEVLHWMVELFMPPTATLKEQSSRVKNAYGLSEFPGISVNGVISSLIELELVPVPENDVIVYASDTSGVTHASALLSPQCCSVDTTTTSLAATGVTSEIKTLKITCRRGEHFDPRIAIKCIDSSSSSSKHVSSHQCKYRGEIKVRNKDTNVRISYWKEEKATAAAVRDGWFYTGDVGELDYSHLDEAGKPTLRIIDRVANMTELYVDGDSVWVEQSRLEDEVYSTATAVERICLLSDRNQPFLIAVVSPRIDFILKVAADLNITSSLSHPPFSPDIINGEAETSCNTDKALCWKTSTNFGDRKHASESQLRDSHFKFLCRHQAVKAAVLASITAAAHMYSNAHPSSFNAESKVNSSVAPVLRAYEVPAAVLLDSDQWNLGNDMLTVTGKPRRDRVRLKFLREMQDAYSALALGASSSSCLSLDSPLPIQPSLSCIAANEVIFKESCPPRPLQSILGTAAIAVVTKDFNSADLGTSALSSFASNVAFLSGNWASCCQMKHSVSLQLPAVLDLTCSLPYPFAELLCSLSHTVGPLSVAKSGLPLGWGGYLVQPSEQLLPTYPNRGSTDPRGERDYIGFRFDCGDEEANEELNQLLDVMRNCTLCRRESAARWSQELVQRSKAARAAAEKVLSDQTLLVDRVMDELTGAVEAALDSSLRNRTKDTTTNGGVSVDSIFIPILKALTLRLVAVRQAYARHDEESMGDIEEKVLCMEKYNAAADRLRILAPRKGVRVPPMIELGGWFSTGNDLDEMTQAAQKESAASGGGSGGLLSQSLGDAKVWCSISGELIELDAASSGQERYHCLDIQGTDRSTHSHCTIQKLIQLANLLIASDIVGADSAAWTLSRSPPINPCKLSQREFLGGRGEGVWVREMAHFWHLRDRCELPMVRVEKEGGSTRFECRDTPGGFLTRACGQFAERLALGIPDSSNLLFDPTRPHLCFPSCHLAEAGGMDLTADKSFLWLTYSQLHRLSLIVARYIRSLVPRGSFIGICGYNGIEWAVCDIACALAECVSVGLHSTYSTQSAYLAMKTADISMLLCAGDIVYRKCKHAHTNDSGVNGVTGIRVPQEENMKGEEEKAEGKRDSTQGQHSFWTVQEVLQLHQRSVTKGDMETRKDLERFLLGQIVVMDMSSSIFLTRAKEVTGGACVVVNDSACVSNKGSGRDVKISSLRDRGSESEDAEMIKNQVQVPISFLVDVVEAVTAEALNSLHSNSENQSVPIFACDNAQVDLEVHSSNAFESSPEPFASSLQANVDPAEEQLSERNRIFTLLFTSGSTGEPKAVVVSSSSFFGDISSRNYLEPLVTVSYIPLSHSSDRLKMWEFLGNGGRVGFAFYDPSNWMEHETSKKAEIVQSGCRDLNDIACLFRQVQTLQPSAMACPPNIWNGLYLLYRSYVDDVESQSKIGTETETETRTRTRIVTGPNVEKKTATVAVVADYGKTCNSIDVGVSIQKQALQRISALFGPRIKFLVTGGGPTASAVAFADSYGATECGAICSNGVPIREKLVRVRVEPVTIGEDEVEGNSAEGEEVGLRSYSRELYEEGDVGELWVSSPSMSSGYYKDELQTAKSFIRLDDFKGDGRLWYRTGDLVRVLDKGRWLDSGGENFWLPRIGVLGRIGSAVRIRSMEGRNRSVVVSPDVLEGIYAASPMLSQIFIHGQCNSRALVAIVIRNAIIPPPICLSQEPDASVSHAVLAGVTSHEQGAGDNHRIACSHIQCTASVSEEQLVLEEMRRMAASNGLLAAELPLAVYLERSYTWTAQNNMLNASLKKRRAVFLSRYREALVALHAPYIA